MTQLIILISYLKLLLYVYQTSTIVEMATLSNGYKCALVMEKDSLHIFAENVPDSNVSCADIQRRMACSVKVDGCRFTIGMFNCQKYYRSFR